jgi:hypothetical protein
MVMVPPPPFPSTASQQLQTHHTTATSRREGDAPQTETGAMAGSLSRRISTSASSMGSGGLARLGGSADWASSHHAGSFLPMGSTLGPIPTAISSRLPMSPAAGSELPIGYGRLAGLSNVMCPNESLSRMQTLQRPRNFNLEARQQRSQSEVSRILHLRDPIPISSERLLSLAIEQQMANRLAASSNGIQRLLESQRHAALLHFNMTRGSQVVAHSDVGLDLLRSVASARQSAPSGELAVPNPPNAMTFPSNHAEEDEVGANRQNGGKRFVSSIQGWDVLCGRGGKSNHHPGNKRYRQVVSEMKASYRHIEAKTAKTDLSKAIVDHVFGYGGRFIKVDKATDRFYVLTPAESRKKTSQALRETKELKWTL